MTFDNRLISADQAKTLDAVYIDTDPTFGTAGTDWPIGTPGRPVLGLADALVIAARRGLEKIYLAGEGVHTITLTTGFDMAILGGRSYTITVAALATVGIDSDLTCVELINTTGTVVVAGNLKCTFRLGNTTGTISVYGDCYVGGGDLNNTGLLGVINIDGHFYGESDITNSSTGTVTIRGNCFLADGHLVNSGGGDINVFGRLEINGSIANGEGYLDNTGGDDVRITGSCKVGNYITNTTGDIIIQGNVQTGDHISNTTGTVTVYGHIQVGDDLLNTGAAGVITINGNTIIGGDLQNTNTGAVTIGGDCLIQTGALINSGAGDVNIEGSLDVNGLPGGALGYINNTGAAGTDLIVTGRVRCNYFANTAGSALFFSDVQTYGSFTTTTGNVSVGGNLHVSGDLTATTGDILVYGNLYVRGATTISGIAGLLHVYGNTELIGAVGATNAAADIFIDGIAHISGVITATGDVTYLNNDKRILLTTFSLNQPIGNYTLFTGTYQDVVLESLAVRNPANMTAGGTTSFSIQTDDTTPQVIIPNTLAIRAALTVGAQFFWQGFTLVKAGVLVQLTINGAACGGADTLDIVAVWRQAQPGGRLV
jgi:hypothetical protein